MSPTAIILTLAAYVALLLVVAWRTSQRSNNATFFTGGRTTPRAVAAVAMVGAAMSGVTYISVPGTVLTDNFSYVQTTLGFFVGYVIIAYVLIPLYYRLGVVSLYEYLDQRFGMLSHRTGAWLFFVAKIASASLRAYVICVVLQQLLFARLGIPFALNAALMMCLVWLYTRRGGVRSVVWTEFFKTLLMVASIVVCVALVIDALGVGLGGAVRAVAESQYSEVFFFDNPLDGRYFWKQFLAGIFLVVAMTGLDQDMMQTMLSCRTRRDAQRGMMTSILIQMCVIGLFLSLGSLLYIFVSSRGITATEGAMPLIDAAGEVAVARGDDLFGYVATECGLHTIAGVLFLLGLVASTYTSAGSALTALTTSFTLDILRAPKHGDDRRVARIRRWAHSLIAMAMCLIIILFEQWSSSGVITLIFTMASYTYGPLLGLFAFGLLTRRKVHERAVPIIAIAAPALCFIVSRNSASWLGGYTFSYEIIILNALLTMLGLWLASYRDAGHTTR